MLNISYQNTLVFIRNRKYKTLTDCTKKQAEREMRKIMDELESGKYIQKDDNTLAEWMKKWIDLYKKGISPTTQRGYENQIKIYILSQPISKKRIQEITTDDVQSWINTLMDASPTSNNKISAKTIRNVYTNLNAALNKAVSLKKYHQTRVPKLPFQNVENIREKCMTKKKSPSF